MRPAWNHNALSCGLTFAHLTFTLKWHSFDFSEEQHRDNREDEHLKPNDKVGDGVVVLQQGRVGAAATIVSMCLPNQDRNNHEMR